MNPSQIPFLLALHKACNLTFNRFECLKTFFQGDFERAFKASISDWQECGIDKRGIEKFFSQREEVHPQALFETCAHLGLKILVHGEKDFPISLEQIPSPPVILFVRGELLPQDFLSVAVVGSRKLSSYGRRATEHILEPLVRAGVTIISGLAFGTDRLAHELALKNGGRTIAVLGNGIDYFFPATNRSLGEQILHTNSGAVISEYFPQTPVCPAYFPIRNRLISGLAKATLIIEAGKKSGTLITANAANAQGREVFALPGDIFAPHSEGPHQLLLEGMAHPLISGHQILEFLGKTENQRAPQALPEEGIEADILRLFEGGERLHIDELIRKSPLPQAVLTSHLMCLEVKGWVINMGYQTYVRNL